MGQARARAREIAELKQHGRLIDTPRHDKPVLHRVGDAMWLVTEPGFDSRSRAVIANMSLTPVAVQHAFAALALEAERSGVRERDCQEWFRTQCNAWAEAKMRLSADDNEVFASSAK